jgi:anti-sigma factor RsiW
VANADEPGAAPVAECPELPRIHALADGELSAGAAAEARWHLAGCAACRAELAFLMQLAVAIARGVAAIDEPEAFGAIRAFAAIGRPS